jgi:hypothetical protein
MGSVIALRLVHIGFAIFWGGSVLFLNVLLGPSLEGAGPEGFRVLQELNRRRYFDVMLGAAVLTLLSGIELMRRDSANFQPAWFQSSFGMGISTGMLAALITFLIGLLLIKPTLRRLAAIGAQVAATAPEQRGGLLVELNAQRGRLKRFGITGMLFMLIAIGTMAVARYL